MQPRLACVCLNQYLALLTHNYGICIVLTSKPEVGSRRKVRVSLHNLAFLFLEKRKNRTKCVPYFCVFVFGKTEKQNYEAIHRHLSFAYFCFSVFEIHQATVMWEKVKLGLWTTDAETAQYMNIMIIYQYIYFRFVTNNII
jgi:hypothetical protein